MFNKHDLAASGRWIRDHFSNWFANSFVMVGVFAIIMGAIYIGMYFDGEYARRWAPHDGAENIFMVYGWLISLAMVFFTAAGIKAFQEGARFAGATLVIAGVFFTILSATQSVGVVTLKAQEMMAQADAFQDVRETDTKRLDFLMSERTDLIGKRDSEIKRIQSSIDAIEDDGVEGIPLRDQQSIDAYNARIDEIRNNAQAAIDAKGAEIRAELETPEVENEDGETELVVTPPRFDAGIDFWAYVLKNGELEEGEAEDSYKEGLTYWYMLFWSIGCPIMGQMLAVYLVITRRTSQEATKKDPVRVEAGKKAADTTKRRKRQTLKIQEQAESYIPGWRKAVQYARNTKWTAKGIAQTAFPNVAIDHVIDVLRKANKKGDWRPELEEEINLVKRITEASEPDESKKYAVDIIDPDPNTTNGTGQPLDGGIPNDDDDADRVATN